ncbi:MAG: hypothetical protein ABI767_16625 [Rhodanobacter sp.]
MKRTLRRRLLLAFAVVALLLLAGWQLQRDAAGEDGALTSLEPASIQHITLTVPGTPALHYEKRHGHWWRIDGIPTRATDARLNDLTDTAAAPVREWRPASDFNPAKIGLAPPRAVLDLDGTTLEFGELSVTGPQHYVRVGQRVALISARYMPRSPATKTTDLQ